MEGAEYTIKYYDASYTDAETALKSSEMRTWVYKTDSKGRLIFSDETYCIEGKDTLFKNSLGIVEVPTGTLVIYETKAPNGYEIDTNKYVMNIYTSSKDGKDHVHSYASHYKNGTYTSTDDLGEDKAITSEQTTDLETQSTEVITPTISTVAMEVSTGDHSGKDSKGAKIQDTISYYVPLTGDYYFEAEYYDATTGKSLGTVTSKDDKFHIDADNESEWEGTYTMPSFTVDGTTLKGHTVYVREKLHRVYVKTGETEETDKVLVDHDSVALVDNEQAVWFPDVATNAYDGDTDTKTGTVSETETVYDDVSCMNLIAGYEYTIKGGLYYAEDTTLKDGSKAVKGADFPSDKYSLVSAEILVNGKAAGTEVTVDKTNNTVTFKAPKSASSDTLGTDITVRMQYEVNSSALEGTSLVFFEDVLHNNINIASHHDIDDEYETVNYPDLQTRLVALSENGKELKNISTSGTDSTISLTDTVTVENIVVGYPYSAHAVLMDRDTEKEVIDTSTGETVENTVWFCADENGNVTYLTEAEASEMLKKITSSADGYNNRFASHTVCVGCSYDFGAVGKDYSSEITKHNKELHSGKTMGTETRTVLENNDCSITKTDTEVKVALSMSRDSLYQSGSEEMMKAVVCFEKLNINGKETASHEDITDRDQTVCISEIGTTLTDTEYGTHVTEAKENISLTDTVEYKGLYTGLEYTVKGILYDKETGAPLLDDEGNEITAETTFTPSEENGKVDVVFEFSGVSLAGKVTVAFETLYEDGQEIAVHADIEDEEQTVYIPEIGTTLTDVITEEHVSDASEDIILTDTVEYKALCPDLEYTIKGTLYDKETGEPILDDEGNEVTAETTFIPAESEGYEEVTFEFSGVTLAGTVTVAYETLYTGEQEVAVHADIEDEAQTVYIPKIGTTLTGTETETHFVEAADTISLTDTVEYTSLCPDLEYVLEGTLYDEETGEVLLDDEGNEITAETVFTPSEKDGTVDVVFEFNSESIRGKVLVAYEKLYRNDNEVAAHEDIEDEAQTVYIPKIGTTLTDTESSEHIANASENISLTDTVEYTGLKEGEEYTVKGVLHDKETGKVLKDDDGNAVTAETTFIADAADGSADVVFEFKGVTLKGKTVVAFETMYQEEQEIAVHADIEDEAQTVILPQIGTILKYSDGTKTAKAETGTLKLTDTVSYKNLVKGEEYTVTGVLYDKSTGKPFTVNGKEVTGTASFKAEKTSGTAQVTFSFDAKGITKETTLVAFETMYLGKDTKGSVIAEHKDISDTDQTVTVTTPNVKTGDMNTLTWLWVILIGAGFIALVFAGMMLKNRSKKE